MSENNRIEYKETLTDDFELEIIAFLNYRIGGIIYIGVDKNGNAMGVADIDLVQLKIKDRIKNNIRPSTLGLFDVLVEKMDGKSIIKIVISSGQEKPYYLRKKGMTSEGCYIRVGSAKERMTNKMIESLFAKRTRNSLKELEAPRQELTFKQLKIYYEEHHLDLNENFLHNLDLLTSEGKYNYNAFLLADENTVPLPVVKYLGTTKSELIENQDYGNRCLITATQKILDKLDIENKTYAKIEYYGRKEQEMIDSKALKEAVINAIVHNDYSYGNSPIIELYSDRIEITSAGGLPLELSKEEFFKGTVYRRNKELIKIFKDVELIENIGSGVLRILETYSGDSFDFMDNFLRVSFKYRKNEYEYTEQENSENTPESSGNTLDVFENPKNIHEKPNKKTEQENRTRKPNKKEEKIHLILRYCSEPRRVKEIMEFIGLKHRPTFLYTYLYPLLEQGKLKMTIPEQPKNKNQKYIKK